MAKLLGNFYKVFTKVYLVGSAPRDVFRTLACFDVIVCAKAFYAY